ncbi:FAD-dependent oxidoreductase [Streptomyces sp. CC208A]|uniref:FAD-dependent oxidoreductase n=1 Tax=Streptomyces sp. CC208A TaxID=3044573 RepID=UPI0024A9E5BB|nr:FAD-dependent oxidoreductase [Streptomyces sp. CC208A]
MTRRVLVVGGGISGLATAVALGTRGHEVLVLEQRPVFAGSAAGTRLTPHDFRLLDLLGVGHAVRERSLALDELRVLDGSTGALVASLPGHATAHRLDLYEPLLDACHALDAVRLRPGSRVTGRTRHGATVTVALADGRAVTGDALVLTGGARRHDEGVEGGEGGDADTVYRTVVPMEAVAERWQESAATCWVGEDWRVSHYPLPDHRYLGLSATRHRGGGRAGTAAGRVRPEDVLAAFPDAGRGARDVLALGEHWRAWSVPGRRTAPVPVSASARGRVALVGATAHGVRRLGRSCVHEALDGAVALGAAWDASTRLGDRTPPDRRFLPTGYGAL